MTIHISALSIMATAALFFTSKTESSRIVTIQRPMVITQERKTPAYFVYQQTQKLAEKSRALVVALKTPVTTYLSNLSLPESETKIQISEMKFNKNEFAAPLPTIAKRLIAKRFIVNDPKYEVENKIYEQAFGAKSSVRNFAETTIPQSAVQAVPGSTKKWATIRGKFELTEGVGIVDHYIELTRIEEGQIRETGRIDLKAGLYSIDIESPRGYLMAQIKDRNGLIIGEDHARIINLQSRGSFYEGPFLRIGQPASIAANLAFSGRQKIQSATPAEAQSATAAQEISATIFNNQNPLAKPSDIFSNISRYSSTISRVFDPSRIYKNITSIRHAGEKSQTSMFTTKWIDGVVSYVSDTQKIVFKEKNAPILIGRVLINDKPAAGAEVQIYTAPGVAAIYFDHFMIPSATQTKTSANGYFMFVGLEPESYQLVASRQVAGLDGVVIGSVVLGSQMFIAENDSVAFQNITSQNLAKSKVVRSFDAFSGEPIETELVFAEAEGVIELAGGTSSLRTFSEIGISEYQTTARTADRLSAVSYVPIRYVQDSRQEYIHLPMLQEQWLQETKDYKKITQNPEAGIIIGFTPDQLYDVYLLSVHLLAENYNVINIVYFDASGNGTTAPIAGGGFILFNVPAGAQEVVLQEPDTERIHSQVFNVFAEQISVAHFAAD